MSGIYQVTSDDINQLMKQTVINEEHARELLLKNLKTLFIKHKLKFNN